MIKIRGQKEVLRKSIEGAIIVYYDLNHSKVFAIEEEKGRVFFCLPEIVEIGFFDSPIDRRDLKAAVEKAVAERETQHGISGVLSRN